MAYTAKAVVENGTTNFRIELQELREIALDTFKGVNRFNLASNYKLAREHTADVRESFHGYSAAQANDWIENGYTGTPLPNVEDFMPPLRDKRKFIYAEEGDEIDLSAAWSGEDNFMGQWTRRATLPGVAFQFRYRFVGSTSAKIVNEYLSWVSGAIEALTAAGIDPEISVNVGGALNWMPNGRKSNISIRVKKENETADTASYSSMLSPAGYRTMGFLTTILAGDSVSVKVDSGISSRVDARAFTCNYNSEVGAIIVETPWEAPRLFDDLAMTNQLRKAISDLQND